jgi:hypothetical protein
MSAQIITPSNALWTELLLTLRHDIYHLPNYLHLEAQRLGTIPKAFVLIEKNKIFFLPYLLRSCATLFPEDVIAAQTFDVVSPYGYPGILLNDAAVHAKSFLETALTELINSLVSQGVCSVFLRLHPILNEYLSKIQLSHSAAKVELVTIGDTISVDLTLEKSEIWNHTRADQRNKINKAKRMGLVPRIVQFEDYFEDFLGIYNETMQRVEAQQHYYSFNRDYFLSLKEILEERLSLCIVQIGKHVASAGIYSESCGIVQGVFGGARNEFLYVSPTSLETDFMRNWAKERGNKFLHLGGGVGGAQDSLYKFKTGFSRKRHTFMALRLILDQHKYNYFLNLRAKTLNIQVENLLKGLFFPAYYSN